MIQGKVSPWLILNRPGLGFDPLHASYARVDGNNRRIRWSLTWRGKPSVRNPNSGSRRAASSVQRKTMT